MCNRFLIRIERAGRGVEKTGHPDQEAQREELMGNLEASVDDIKCPLIFGKRLTIVLVGHNGSGKPTLWYDRLADKPQVPLIKADQMMLSILPERSPQGVGE